MSSSVKVISRSKGLFYIVEHEDTIKIIAKATHTLAPGIPISQSSQFVKEKDVVIKFSADNIGGIIEPELGDMIKSKQNLSFLVKTIEKRSIHTFEEFVKDVRGGRLQYNDLENMVKGIQKQIEQMYTQKKTITQIEPKHLFVLNETFYIYTNFDNMEEFTQETRDFVITQPVDLSIFNNVVVDGIDNNGEKRLPYDFWVSSFAKLMFYGLTGKKILPDKDEDVEKEIEMIYATPIYYCLKRAFNRQKLLLL